MNVAILYRKPDKVGKDYPLDSQGRDGLKHVIRIKDSLQALNYEPLLLDLNLDTYEKLKEVKIDLAFNLCDDGFCNDPLLEAHLPAMLDILQIPYTGSDFLTLATCVNKARTKEILTFHNIPTPQFQTFLNSKEKLNKKGLNFPLIVKPLHEDASIGVKKESVVTNLVDLKKRIDFTVKNYNQPAVVERFIEGREVYVGILGNKDNLTVLPITEVMFDKKLAQNAKICSYDAKWVPETEAYKNTPVQCPAKLNKTLKQRLIAIAKEAYNILECHDYGRVDFRIDNNNHPYVLEVNPNPDISEDAGLAKMARAKGMDYDQLIRNILSSAIERKNGKQTRAF